MKKRKEILDRYVITTDCEDLKELEKLIELLKKYNVIAYNYKVEYLNGKVSIRVVKGNIILNLSNLSLSELEEFLKDKEEFYISKFRVEFHNVKPTRDIIDKLEKLNLPYSEVHIFKDYVKIKTISGLSFIDDKDLEATYDLSQVMDKISLKPLNLGRIKKVKDMYALVLLKLYGIRDLNLIDKILNLNYNIINNSKIVIKDMDLEINEKGIFIKGKEISKKDLYKILEERLIRQ